MTIIILETPHRGKPSVWLADNEQAIIDIANNIDGFNFDDKQSEIEQAKEWLGHDLSSIGFYTVDELKDHQGNADQEFAVKQFIDDNDHLFNPVVYTVDELKDHQGNADQEFAVKQFIDDNDHLFNPVVYAVICQGLLAVKSFSSYLLAYEFIQGFTNKDEQDLSIIVEMTPLEYQGRCSLRYLFGREFFREEPTVEEVEDAISKLSNAEEIYKKLSGIIYKSHYWVLDLYGEHIINEIIHIYNYSGEPCESDLKSYDDFLDGLIDEIAYSRRENK